MSPFSHGSARRPNPGNANGGSASFNVDDMAANAGIDINDISERLHRAGKKAGIIFGIVWLVLLAFCYWWFHPPINLHSLEFWEFLAIGVLLPAIIVLYLLRRMNEAPKGKSGGNPKKAKLYSRLMLIPLIVILIGVLGMLLSQSFIPGNAEKFSSILQTEDTDFTEGVEEVDYSQIPFIDRDSAMLLGNRTMGVMADYVSQFEISPLYSQINYQGAPVRVSPLNYADIFKWWTNQGTGIPGYVVVNMSTQDTEIVRPDEPIRYSDSDPFFKNVDRHVQLSRPFYIYGEKSFEIDEEGNPFWIYPVLDYTIGLFSGETVSRVVICNACTGEIQDYAIQDVPQWVDRAYPADLLIKQYNWSGALSGGWINSWLGQNGVKQTTPGTDGKNGYNFIAQGDDVWLYSGVTSATADNSIIGFVMINQRTGESKFYSVAGATEDSSMHSAEGQVQHLKYDATFPLLINVHGVPTYFMALKDDAGLVKMYAMIDIERYQNVAVGDTLAATEKNYENLLRQNGISTSGSGNNASVGDGVANGTIAEISPVVIDGNSHYYVILDGDPNIYDCPISSVVDIVRYSVGDRVTLNFTPGGTLVTVNSVQAG
ncbi:MAG: Tat pathway signal sequence [Eggerthellaceae bacterium]|nr:Tat pathway signal sequence [Eggerthellaceae bacterium]